PAFGFLKASYLPNPWPSIPTNLFYVLRPSCETLSEVFGTLSLRRLTWIFHTLPREVPPHPRRGRAFAHYSGGLRTPANFQGPSGPPEFEKTNCQTPPRLPCGSRYARAVSFHSTPSRLLRRFADQARSFESSEFPL